MRQKWNKSAQLRCFCRTILLDVKNCSYSKYDEQFIDLFGWQGDIYSEVRLTHHFQCRKLSSMVLN